MHAHATAANVITTERVREVMLAVDRGNYAPDRPYDDRWVGAAACLCMCVNILPCRRLDGCRIGWVRHTSHFSFLPFHSSPPTSSLPSHSPQYLGFEQTISAPHMHAHALELLKDKCVRLSIYRRRCVDRPPVQ